MHRVLLAAIGLLAARGCPPSPPHPPPTSSAVPDASAPPAAVWRTKSFARATEGCTQTWSCDCSAVKAAAGCHLEPTPSASTQGVCAFDSAPNECSRCMALEPAAACACKSVCL